MWCTRVTYTHTLVTYLAVEQTRLLAQEAVRVGVEELSDKSKLLVRLQYRRDVGGVRGGLWWVGVVGGWVDG